MDDTLLCLFATEDDSEDDQTIEDMKTLLAFSLLKEPKKVTFAIDLQTIDQKSCIELFWCDIFYYSTLFHYYMIFYDS